MNFNRNIIVCILAVACCEGAISADSDPPRHPGRSLLFFPPFISITKPNNKPFGIFSKPPHSEDEQQKGGQQQSEGGGIAVHVGNVLHGGTLGIHIRPLAPLQGILDHAKKFIPGRHGTVGRPSHEKPDNDGHGTVGRPGHEKPHHDYDGQGGHGTVDEDRPHHERPNYENDKPPHKDQPPYHERPHEDRPNHDKPPYHERPNYENPKHDSRPPYHERPHQQRPGHQRPNTDHPPKKEEDNGGPQWEDIGEVATGEDIGELEEYGEGVLQPRRRPKRFVESKIYHVPLMFRSNGRTEKVRIRQRNGLRERKNSEY